MPKLTTAGIEIEVLQAGRGMIVLRVLACVAVVFAAPAMAQSGPPISAGARVSMAEFARCVIRNSPQKAHSALTRDFRTTAYRQELRVLAANNSSCHDRRRMRVGGLPFAAAMAEALLSQSGEPLNVRLVRAAPTNAPTYAPSDQIAMCIARSAPDEVAALLGSPIASGAEATATARLGLAVGRCTPAGGQAKLDPYGLRSILATASYRLLAAARVSQ